MTEIKKIAVILNGFIHDLASGYWLSCIIAIMFLNHFQVVYPELSLQLNILERFFFWNSIGAALIIFITGGARTFTYVENVYGSDSEKARRKMLILKHIILFMIFGAGTLLAYSMSFR